MQILPSATALLALLPSLIAADQKPLKEKVADVIDKVKKPVNIGMNKVVESNVEKLNIRNYRRKLGPKPDVEEEWMIYFTGKNKTCYGNCGHADSVWNSSVPLLQSLPYNIPSARLKLGTINCDADEILCTALAVALPSIQHIIFPQSTPSNLHPLAPLHDIPLNLSGVSVDQIIGIPRNGMSTYKDWPEYTGALHLTDGWMAKYNLLHPFGYVMWGFGAAPTWLLMIVISFISRQYMANRAGRRVDNAMGLNRQGASGEAAAGPGAPPPPAPVTPAPAPAAAKGSKSGSGKKRR